MRLTIRRAVLLLCAAAAIAVPVAVVVPAGAEAYLHQADCQSGLRSGGAGDYERDDDVHAAGVAIHATAWGGWSQFWRMSSTYVRQDFYVLVNGVWGVVRGYCQGNLGGFQDWWSYQ